MTTPTAQSVKSTTGRKPLIPPWVRQSVHVADRLAPRLTNRWLRRMYFTPGRMKFTPAQQQVLSQGTRFTFDVMGESVVAHAWGDADRAVWLVHGWAGHQGQLSGLVQPLLEAGLRVVSFDWPGHGLSGGRVSSLLHARHAMQTLSGLTGAPHGVIAHSFGSAATTLAMADGLGAQRLAFIAPAISLQPYIERFSLAMGLSREQKQRFIDASEQWLEAPFSSFEPLAHVASQQAPLQVFHSRDDREAELSEAEALVAQWPGAALEVLEGLGHRKILGHAPTVAAAVAWVRK